MKAAFMTGVNEVEVRETRRADARSRAARSCASRRAASAGPTPGRSSTATRGPRRRGCSATSRSASSSEVGPGRRSARRGSRRATGCSSARSSRAASAGGASEGFQNLCEHHLLYGYDPFPGAYAEYAAGAADRHEEPDPAAARPAVGPGHGRRSVRLRAERHRAARRPASATRVVILGAGPIGCWQAVMARDRGAGRVFLTDVIRGAARPGARRVGHVRRRRMGGRRGQRRRGGAGADRRARRRAGQRGGARRSRRSRPRWRWRPSAPASCTSPGCPSTTR